MLPNSNLRAVDALHVTAAQAAEAELFVTSDDRQAEGAKRVKLKVVRIG